MVDDTVERKKPVIVKVDINLPSAGTDAWRIEGQKDLAQKLKSEVDVETAKSRMKEQKAAVLLRQRLSTYNAELGITFIDNHMGEWRRKSDQDIREAETGLERLSRMSARREMHESLMGGQEETTEDFVEGRMPKRDPRLEQAYDEYIPKLQTRVKREKWHRKKIGDLVAASSKIMTYGRQLWMSLGFFGAGVTTAVVASMDKVVELRQIGLLGTLLAFGTAAWLFIRASMQENIKIKAFDHPCECEDCKRKMLVQGVTST